MLLDDCFSLFGAVALSRPYKGVHYFLPNDRCSIIFSMCLNDGGDPSQLQVREERRDI